MAPLRTATANRKLMIANWKFAICILQFAFCNSYATAQPLGQPDRGSPGDEMIQRYLVRETAGISARFADDLRSRQAWETNRPQLVEEYHYMLGLSPRP
jgi:hypothetical protein